MKKLESSPIIESTRDISRRLLEGYYKDKFSLSPRFLCIECFGILIDPFSCKNCQSTYCQACLYKINQIIINCQCKDGSYIENFTPNSIQGLEETNYFFTYSQNKILYLSYNESIKYIKNEIKNQLNQEGNIKLNKSIKRLNSETKIARLVNFCFAKGYNFELDRKQLTIPMIHNMKKFHCKIISLKECKFSLNCAKELARLFKRNLHTIREITYWENEFNEHRNSIVIFKAIEILKYLHYLDIGRVYYEEGSTTKNCFYFEFINSKRNLRTLIFYNQVFKEPLNLEYFKNLKFLNNFQISQCKFTAQSLFILFDSIKNLSKLEIISIHYIGIQNVLNIDLIQKFKTVMKNFINLKKVSIYFDNECNLGQFINIFFDNLKSYDRIEALDLYSHNYNPTFDIQVISSYFSTTKKLKRLDLPFVLESSVATPIIKSILSNFTFEELNFGTVNLENFYKIVVKYVKENLQLKKLCLNFTNIHVKSDLVEAAMLNKALKHLDLWHNQIEEDVFVHFDISILQKIHFDSKYKGRLKKLD